MLHIADNSDIMRHYKQVRDAGMIPAQLALQGVEFVQNGSILVDAGFDLPAPFGELDIKLKVQVKLLSDKRVIRIRLVDIELIDFGVRGLVMKLVEKLADQFQVPGLRAVRDGKDIYWEYTPMKWVLLQDILTVDNRLTVVADGVDIPLLAAETRKAQLAALNASPSMADKATAAQLKAKPIPATAPTPNSEQTVAYPAPNLADGKLTASVNR